MLGVNTALGWASPDVPSLLFLAARAHLWYIFLLQDSAPSMGQQKTAESPDQGQLQARANSVFTQGCAMAQEYSKKSEVMLQRVPQTSF